MISVDKNGSVLPNDQTLKRGCSYTPVAGLPGYNSEVWCTTRYRDR